LKGKRKAIKGVWAGQAIGEGKVKGRPYGKTRKVSEAFGRHAGAVSGVLPAESIGVFSGGGDCTGGLSA
jgi:hypothetical protein